MATEVHDIANGNLKETTEVNNDDGEIKGKVEVTKLVDVIESGDANGKLDGVAEKEELLPKKGSAPKHDFPEGEGPQEGEEENSEEEEAEARGLVEADEEEEEEEEDEDDGDDDEKEVEGGEEDYAEDEGDEDENEEDEDDEEAAPEPPSKRRK